MTLTPQFVEYMPDVIEDGILYISQRFSVAIHKCAGGCGIQAVMDISNWGDSPWKNGWRMTINDNLISFSPSILCPCKAHYFIENNEIRWC
jgi:hypothetical protein